MLVFERKQGLNSRYFTFLSLILIGISSSAQDGDEVQSVYLFPDFVDGRLLMKSGDIKYMKINYNKSNEELIFVSGLVRLAITKTDTELVDTVYVGNRKFIRANDIFMELLYLSNSMALCVQHKCEVEFQTKSRFEIGRSAGQRHIDFYETRIPDKYTVLPYSVYWFLKDGVWNEIAEMNDFKKLYKNNRKKLRTYLQSYEVGFENSDSVAEMVKHLELQSQ